MLYPGKQDSTAMKYLYKSTDQAVKITGLISGSRKAIKTHKHSPEVHAMPKPGPGVRTNARSFFCSLEIALTSSQELMFVKL